MIFYTNILRIQLILHSLNYTHTHTALIPWHTPAVYFLEEEKLLRTILRDLVALVEWTCCCDVEVIPGAALITIWARHPT